MGKDSGIEWTDATWNPWYGCHKVSPGCAHCYAEREMTRYGRDFNTVTRSKTKFTEPLSWDTPRVCFTCSWSDWFHEAADAWRPEAWDVVNRARHILFLILTKRPERIREHLPASWGPDGWPNVWLGTSVENQRHAERAARLLKVPAAVHFISAEPLLGPVDLTRIFVNAKPRREGELIRINQVKEVNALAGTYTTDMNIEYRIGGAAGEHPRRIKWVIAGGESGPDYRAMDIAWARALRDQCAAHDAAFFLKQLGGWPDKHGAGDAVLDGVRHTARPPVPVLV